METGSDVLEVRGTLLFSSSCAAVATSSSAWWSPWWWWTVAICSVFQKIWASSSCTNGNTGLHIANRYSSRR